MKRLKIILQCNWIFFIIFFFSIIYCFIFISIPKESKYEITNNKFKCIIDDMYINKDYLSMNLLCKEKIKANYYFKSNEEKIDFISKYNLGDKVLLIGNLTLPKENTNFNTFNYKKYLYYEEIFYLLNIEKYEKISSNSNFIYKIKNIINKRIKEFNITSSYLNALLLGNDNYLDDEIVNTYREIGISHLFAISGMHITILSSILLLFLKKIKISEKISYLIVSFFLLIYLFLIGFYPSIMRAVILFLLLSINKIFKLNIKVINLFLLTISIILLLQPFVVSKIGFYFSVIVSFSLIIFNRLINKRKTYFGKLLMTSFIAFVVGIPINIYCFYQINVFSFLYNLLFVPLMTFILFPLSLITFFIPLFDVIFKFIIYVFETLALIFVKVPSNFVFMKPNFIIIIIYYVIIFLVFNYFHKTKKYLIVLLMMLVVHYNFNLISKNNYALFLDVGQGDSVFINYNEKTILIDTGGKFNSDITNSVLLPVLKSKGIKKIDNLIITHGDYDHMGEAINLVNNFKVEKVIFNCGEFNELEKELIKVLDKKKIKYDSCIKELNIDKNKLYFLQTKEYDNENDNSNVIYTELNNYKFMFMGDASITTEREILDKYNLKDIDVLKVGHHGSKTSSSKEFIDEIKPKYSIISVGKNNRYGHPNEEVLNNLENTKIYRTDQDGSIMFKIKNNQLKIETCSP